MSPEKDEASFLDIDFSSLLIMIMQIVLSHISASFTQQFSISFNFFALQVWICGAHGIIMYCVWRYSILHSPINCIIVACSVNDVAMNVSASFIFTYAIVLDGEAVADWTCHVSGCIGVGSFFAICYITTVMAYERYR